MNVQVTVAALTLLVLTSNVQAQGNFSAALAGPDLGSVQGEVLNPNWNVRFAPVPKMLRLHVPELQAGHGVLISRGSNVPSSGIFYRLQSGDVLLAVGARNIHGMDSIPERPSGTLAVLRRGAVIPVRPIAGCIMPPFPRQRGLGLPTQQLGINPWSGGVSAVATSSGNESVSVSQNGNQISLEMSLPDLESQTIRYQGTRESIRRQVESSQLSPAARQRVMEALQ
ncbi:MAG: hypothetical protein AB8B91_01350 [Rubripirellula sp.]